MSDPVQAFARHLRELRHQADDPPAERRWRHPQAGGGAPEMKLVHERPDRAQLTQFDDPANTSITLLVATQNRLFVGFDSPRGVLVMRSKGTAPPAVRSDFEQVGAAGLGVSATRIFDAKYLPFGGVDSVYATVGDGTFPVRLVRLAN